MLYPALSVTGVDGELALGVADDHFPTAAEQSGHSLTIFFRDAASRDAAQRAIADAFAVAILEAREVDDEDWARRSQEDLQPITVGRLTVRSSSSESPVPSPSSSPESPAPSPISITIRPSMGFGTGHHATTRLCLRALQREELAGRSVLDIGTGSGILAIAAVRLGAASALGIDNDPDAIQAARENLALNPEALGVTFEVAQFGKGDASSVTADIVTANLTGALLTRVAHLVLAAVRPGGRLIVSGLLAAERDQVRAAFEPAAVLWDGREDEWAALTFDTPNVFPDFLSNR